MTDIKRICVYLINLWLVAATAFPASVVAQDARELQREQVASTKLKGEHPLFALMRTRKSSLRPELVGVHPRVFVTEKELADLRTRAHATHRELWQEALKNVRVLQTE